MNWKNIVDFNYNFPPQILSEDGRTSENLSEYTSKYGSFDESPAGTLEETIEQLRGLGLSSAVISARDHEHGSGNVLPNDTMVEIKEEYPDFFVLAFAGCDPHKGMDGVAGLERAIMELGMDGCHVNPWQDRLKTNDKRYYPIYAKCAELDVPVSVHSVASLDSTARMNYGKPLHLDEVAVDFPELTIIAVHPGYPWGEELASVAYRHDNVYIDMSGLHPDMWGPLEKRGRTILQNKILFGSAHPLITPKKALAWVDEYLDWPEEVMEKFLKVNARKLISDMWTG